MTSFQSISIRCNGATIYLDPVAFQRGEVRQAPDAEGEQCHSCGTDMPSPDTSIDGRLDDACHGPYCHVVCSCGERYQVQVRL